MKPFKKIISGVLIISSLLLALYHLNRKDIQWVSVNKYVGVTYNRTNDERKPQLNNEDVNHGLNKSHGGTLAFRAKDFHAITTDVKSFPTERDVTMKKTDVFDYAYTQENQPVADRWRENSDHREHIEQITKEVEYRKQLLRKKCHKYRIRENSSLSGQDSTLETYSGTKQGDPVEYVSISNFHLVRSASTLTCLINKVASTSLAVSLLQADGRPIPEWNEELSPHNAVSVLKPKTQAEFNFARKHFFKFLLVRNPFERLLSAYRDKVERADHWSLKKLRQHIIKTVKELRELRKQRDENYTEVALQASTEKKSLPTEDRGYLNASSNQQIPPTKTHSDLQQHISKRNIVSNGIQNTDQRDRKAVQKLESPVHREMDTVTVTSHTGSARTSNTLENRIRNGSHTEILAGRPLVLEELPDEGEEKETPLPTFGDFLEYILVSDADGDFSSHWIPYWEKCTPCSIQYDVIAKLETMDRDLSVVYERLGISQKNRQPWYNSSAGSKSPKRDIVSHYYSQLDPFLIGRMYRRYALDFHLFEYDIFHVFRQAGLCITSSCEEVSVYL